MTSEQESTQLMNNLGQERNGLYTARPGSKDDTNIAN